MGSFIINIQEIQPIIQGKTIQTINQAGSGGTWVFELKSNIYNTFALLSDYTIYNSFNKLYITYIDLVGGLYLEHDGNTIGTGNLPYEIDISSVINDTDLIPNLNLHFNNYNVPGISNFKFKFYITDSNNTISNITETIIYIIQ